MPDTTWMFIAIGPNAWGKADTQQTAIKRMRTQVPNYIHRPYKYFVWHVHPDTSVNGVDGGLSYPVGHKPVLILEGGASRKKSS